MPSPESLRETVRWVGLPHRLTEDGTEIVLSVFVGPALSFLEPDSPATVGDFPAWVDWPATLAELDMTVELTSGGGTLEARRVSPAPSSHLWSRLVPATTPVAAFAREDLAARPVLTFSAGTLLDSLRRSYARLFREAIDDLPLIAPSIVPTLAGEADGAFADIGRALADPVSRAFLTGDDDTFARTLTAATTRARGLVADSRAMVEVVPSTGEAGGEFVRAVAFHRGPAAPPTRTPAALARVRDTMDFHRTVAAFGEHPALLRELGLVVDVAVPTSALGGAISGAVRVVVHRPSSAPAAVVDECLWVRWRLDRDSAQPFAAAPADPASPVGFLDVGPGSGFRVEHLAIDGAAINAVTAVAGVSEQGSRAAPPALRSRGLTLLHEGRAAATHAELLAVTNEQRGADPDHALSAEELVRGYRVDVHDADNGHWSSLHGRRTQFLQSSEQVMGSVSDEGWHQPAAASAATASEEPPPDAPLYLHESFVRWDGWSLSAPRPGKAISVDPTGPDPDRPETLPRRVTNDPFSHSELQIETRVEPRSLPRLRFGHRYRLRVRTVDIAGNGLTKADADAEWVRLTAVERTLGTLPTTFERFEPIAPPAVVADNQAPESVHRLLLRTGIDDDLRHLLEENDRASLRLYAPKGSLQLAEWHGLLDDAIGEADAAARREIFELAARESGTLPDTGADEVPYLPDPRSVGIAVARAPGVEPGTTVHARWQAAAWHSPKPITLRLATFGELSTGIPEVDEEVGTFTIGMHPARRSTLRVSSHPDPEHRSGLLEWCAPVLHEDELLGLREAVEEGRHCMVTPWQEIELIHAVQRPLSAPDLEEGIPVLRSPGATDYRFTGTLRPDPFSTSTLSLAAEWAEWTDDPAVVIVPDRDGKISWSRNVATVVGHTPLKEPPFPPGAAVVLTETDLYFAGSSMPLLQLTDTKHRVITFSVTAVSRFAEFFPELADRPDAFTRTGSPLTCVIASTARPPAPVVTDLVPLLHREVDADNPAIRRREGGWLRVQLERPWFTTGAGEQLGLVVADQPPAGPASSSYDLVTVIGTDLAHFSTPAPPLRADQVQGFTRRTTGVVLPESLPSGTPSTVTILGFDPQFDPTSQRWFADVRINVPEAYFPMVRLAFVRYQPNSVRGTAPLSPDHFSVSAVVVTATAPLFPDRTLQISGFEGNPDLALEGETRFRLSGVTYASIQAPDGTDQATREARARVQARIQVPGPVGLTAADDRWVTVKTFAFHRDDMEQPWRLTLRDSDFGDIGGSRGRILVVEEDLAFYDPARPQEAPLSPRLIYAEVASDGSLPTPPPEPDPPEKPPFFEDIPRR